MTRVAAIGLDAMEWKVAERLMADGHMPHLQALRERGACCRLENVVPYRSELPWTLFLTGRAASDNGYWSTVEFDPATYEAYTIGAHPVPPFYALGPDTKVIAFDVPHSVPDRGVHGIQVTAWGAHSPQFAASVRAPRAALRDRRSLRAASRVRQRLRRRLVRAPVPRQPRRRPDRGIAPAGRHRRVAPGAGARLGLPLHGDVRTAFGRPPHVARRRRVAPASRLGRRPPRPSAG